MEVTNYVQGVSPENFPSGIAAVPFIGKKTPDRNNTQLLVISYQGYAKLVTYTEQLFR